MLRVEYKAALHVPSIASPALFCFRGKKGGQPRKIYQEIAFREHVRTTICLYTGLEPSSMVARPSSYRRYETDFCSTWTWVGRIGAPYHLAIFISYHAAHSRCERGTMMLQSDSNSCWNSQLDRKLNPHLSYTCTP